MFRFRLLGLLVSLLTLGSATARAEPSWYGAEQGGSVHLVLGDRATGKRVVDIACLPGSGTLTVRSLIGSNGLLPGEAAEVMLENNRARVSFPGKAIANEESGGIDVEGHGPLGGLATIVKTNRPFVMAVKGARFIMSQAGMAEPYAALLAGCSKG
ncbi:hypothetical protein J2X65_002186 [Ancylobacter sp. 3268]|uniref:hypothetical protein n=1 Tax=Ancylobacter sp. 3268 TaxID=2817752 RepID=UPI0028674EA7|nr:hypothetical protein [Ancylobacter sp. 3268]MDR6952827.1 hypothetical protein [Ancylobacter sp. 3268]